MSNIILFSGYKKVGKTTLANELVRDFGYTKVALADPIKKHVAVTNNMTLDVLEREKRFNPKLVVDQQEYADKIKRVYGKNFFVVYAFNRIISLSEHGKHSFVVDDIRYSYELDYFLQQKDFTVNHFVLERDGTKPFNDHSSENIPTSSRSYVVNCNDISNRAYYIHAITQKGQNEV